MINLNKKAFVYFFGILVLCSFPALAQESKKQKSVEDEIRRLDRLEAEAILKKDFAALDKFAATDFTTNSPRNAIVRGKEELKDLLRKGVIDYASFTRETEAVLIYGKTAVSMGNEIIVMGEKTPQKGQTIKRRYTNVWIKRNGNWLLSARHANIICD